MVKAILYVFIDGLIGVLVEILIKGIIKFLHNENNRQSLRNLAVILVIIFKHLG